MTDVGPSTACLGNSSRLKHEIAVHAIRLPSTRTTTGGFVRGRYVHACGMPLLYSFVEDLGELYLRAGVPDVQGWLLGWQVIVFATSVLVEKLRP